MLFPLRGSLRLLRRQRFAISLPGGAKRISGGATPSGCFFGATLASSLRRSAYADRREEKRNPKGSAKRKSVPLWLLPFGLSLREYAGRELCGEREISGSEGAPLLPFGLLRSALLPSDPGETPRVSPEGEGERPEGAATQDSRIPEGNPLPEGDLSRGKRTGSPKGAKRN